MPFAQDSLCALNFTGYITGAGACLSFGDEVVREDLIDPELLIEAARHALELEIPVMFGSRENTVVLFKRGSVMVGLPTIPAAKTIEELKEIEPQLRFCKLCTFFNGGGATGRD